MPSESRPVVCARSASDTERRNIGGTDWVRYRASLCVAVSAATFGQSLNIPLLRQRRAAGRNNA